MPKSLVEEYLEDPMHLRLYLQEGAIMAVTDLIEEAMETEGVSRAELARRLGKSKGWVTQLLDGEANKTIRTVADVLAVLGYAYHSSHEPIRVGSRTVRSPNATSNGHPKNRRPVSTVTGRAQTRKGPLSR